MKTFDEILLQLKNDIGKDLPALLAAQSLQNFDLYEIGSSKDPKQKALLIYYSSAVLDKLINSVTVILHMQLFQCEELITAKYMQVLTDYMRKYNPFIIGMTILDSMEVEVFPIEKNSTTFVLVVCTFQEFLDSCD
jgi:Na+/melibiose symporter-like transporter